ncbi:MAG: flavodoxin [Lachnospiraceae bacterium]|nr:flavodoxin [Lachnospiraceae bacterium]MDO5550943.1 flavodoxin [Lachnospiraceae bacterium]
MSKIAVVYWSGTGNTESMANMVADGIKAGGKEADVIPVDAASAADLKDMPVFALGCPSMGAEQLEESVMEGFVTEVEGFASGKTIGLFGSYGWGDGQWMRDWVERMENAGATVLGGEEAICNDAPDADAEAACNELGKKLAAV